MQLIEQVDGVTDNSRSKRKLTQYLTDQAQAAKLTAQTKTNAKSSLLDQASKTNAVSSPTPAQPSPQVTIAAPLVTDPNAAAGEQSPYFREERAQVSPTALRVLELSGNSRVAASENNGLNASVASGGSAALAVLLSGADRNGTAKSGNSSLGCNFSAGEFPQVTPLRAVGPGDTLSIKSRTAQVLCVADVRGKFEPRALTPGIEQKFQGRPPWRLQADKMADLEIVFQGLPLRKPSYVKDRMELLERS